jgi:hypothetical protein
MTRLLGTRWAMVLFVCAALPLSARAADVLYSCPSGLGIADGVDRGFYVENSGGLTLGVVTLTYETTGQAGDYTVNLTAHQQTFDGPVLGSVDVTFDQTGGMRGFDFHDVSINSNMTIAFVQTLTSHPPDGFAYFDCGPCSSSLDCTSCPGIVETEDTTPPLSVFRRGSVGLTITGRAITPVAPDTWGEMKSLYR